MLATSTGTCWPAPQPCAGRRKEICQTPDAQVHTPVGLVGPRWRAQPTLSLEPKYLDTVIACKGLPSVCFLHGLRAAHRQPGQTL